MAKIKIIWNDNTTSYVSEKGNATRFFDCAKEYRTILTAERSARIYFYNNASIKEVRIIDEENNKEYHLIY